MSYISKTKSLSPATKSFREQLLWGGTCRFLVAIFPLLKALRLKKNWKVLCRCEVSHETNIDLLISYNLHLTLRREGQLLASNPGSSRIPYKNPRALSIYTIHRGRNFRCKYSMLQLFQTQNGKIRKCISINWKLQKEKENALIKSIAYNF